MKKCFTYCGDDRCDCGANATIGDKMLEARGNGYPQGWDRDETKTGIFRDHSCSRCQSGALPCIKGNGLERDCDTLHARND